MADAGSQDAAAVFAAVSQQVLAAHPDDDEGRMLRSPALRTSGAAYAFVTAAGLVVKLPEDRVAQLVESGRGLPCSPGRGRPMREWVRLPATDEAVCREYVLEARAFVRSLQGVPRRRAARAR